MTLIRRAAVAISTLVMRWASPGTKDWAEGLAREVEFIEGDWRALAWAFGSMRVLLDRREAGAASLNGAYVVARTFFEQRKGQIPVFYTDVASGMYLAALLYMGEHFHLGAGIFLASGAMLFLSYRFHVYRSFVVPQPANLKECVLCYRSELQREIESIYG